MEINFRATVSMYTLNTVTYGLTSAPFLAIRCLVELAHQNMNTHPKAANAILHDFYVDDFISGADSTEQAVELAKQVDTILKSGGFNLRKWTSNCAEVTEQIHFAQNNVHDLHFGQRESTKLLGLYWSCHLDILRYTIRELPNCRKVSKMIILSVITNL